MDYKKIWEAIAHEYNLELEEPFKIEELKPFIHRFTAEGLQFYSKASRCWTHSSYEYEAAFLHPNSPKIKKLPWIPQQGDFYYTVLRASTDSPTVINLCGWFGDVDDISRLTLGNVFKTRIEAKAFIPVFDAKLKEVLKDGRA